MRRRAFIGLCAGGAALVVAGGRGLLPKTATQTIGPPTEAPLAKWEWGLASHISEPMDMWRECEWPGYRRFPVREVRVELTRTASPDDPGEMVLHVLADEASWIATESGMIYAVLLRNGSPFWVRESFCMVEGDTLTIQANYGTEVEWAHSWEVGDV